MAFNQETSQKRISRLNSKVAILEAMIEDHSREAYAEVVKRSIFNSILELSLKSNDKATFLQRILDMLVNTDILQIQRKGTIFLLDKQKNALLMQAQTDLTKEEQEFCQRVELGQCLCGKAAATGNILYADHIDQHHERLLPNIDPHGHYCVPIKTATHVLGLINVHIAERTSRNDETIQFLIAVADIAAGTLERIQYAMDLAEHHKGLERKVAEQVRQIEKEKELLTVTLRSIGDGVITTDTKGNVVLLNRVAEELTGWTQEEAKGQPSTKIFHIINEKTAQKCSSPIKRVLELGRIVGLANHTGLIAKNGTIRSIVDSSAPIRDGNSNIVGVVLVFRDVTHERKTEEELLKVRKLESVGVLAGGIAHDFNNILSAILGNIELAKYRIAAEDIETGQLLSDAKKATKRATTLTNQLLTFSKGGDPVKETISLTSTITESANFVLRGSKIKCTFNFPDDLWTVEADNGQISQVIQNIVINAKHAMPEGGTIQVHCANVHDVAAEAFLSVHKGDFIRIVIQDSGIGIPKEALSKIFDPYFSTKQEGNGLGLAICHSIINKHDGHITVQSIPGKGTTFTVFLPAMHSTDTVIPKTLQTRPAVKAARIMVMDDDEMIRDLVRAQLTTLGHEAVLVVDGEQAINKYQELQNSGMSVDLVIMDLTIPGGMGGREASRKLLQIAPETKIIVASGYSTDPIMARYREHGFCGAVAKPFDLDGLRKVIESVLGGGKE